MSLERQTSGLVRAWLALGERDRRHVERAAIARWLYSCAPSERDAPAVAKRKRHPQPPMSDVEREYLGLA
jgi:hypothetical protein